MSVDIIGGGHNGLAAAFYLAQAGLKPVLFETRPVVGGGAITGELHPGFRGPTLAHHTWLAADVIDDMGLLSRGLELLQPAIDTLALDPSGPPLHLYEDVERTVQALRPIREQDASHYPAYRLAIEEIATLIAFLATNPPPETAGSSAADLWQLLGVSRRVRKLGRRNLYRLLRWAPMPVADLAREWFESDLLCAATAGPAVSGGMLGPRSAGTGLVALLHEACQLLAGRPARTRGGPGALTAAMAAAARDAGAEIRTSVRVERIVVANEQVTAVVVDGREVPVSTIVSAVDPKTTFLRLMDPVDLSPEVLGRARHYRAAGTLAKVNLALAGLPTFTGVGSSDLLSGRIHLGPSLDYLERAFDHAKYGELSERPWLDVTIPSILDPQLAPPGKHVMSIYAHYAPYRLRQGEWALMKDQLLLRVLAVLERFAPGIGGLVEASQVITPGELESQYGFHGGHVFHGELTLDQLGAMRPLLGYGRYGAPVRGLYLCGAGTHPGGFMTGLSGKLAAREITRALTGR
jgi:phytoene dehydrogenase-like protein